MDPFTTVTSRICPLDAADVDTDQILPKQFLKRIERSGFGEFAFFDWRFDEHGEPRPEFPMNRPEHAGAQILLTERNFGCGSSREHAPWALSDAGFRVILAPSFADIFRTNCVNVGLLTVALPDGVVRTLFTRVAADPAEEITVDLERCTITGEGFEVPFSVDAHVRHRLLEGLDPIALSEQHSNEVAAFEQRRPSWFPRMTA